MRGAGRKKSRSVEASGMGKQFFLLFIGICLTGIVWADVPVVKAKVSDSGYPTNDGKARWDFDGCADCSGPWFASASGHLGPLDDQRYGPMALGDNDFETCWAVPGGVGESFTLRHYSADRNKSTEAFFPIHSFSIANGYAKNPKRWMQNSRVREMEISLAGQPIMRVRLEDTASIQHIDFPSFRIRRQDRLKFKVLSIYPGTTFDDLCISEFQVNAGH